MAKKTLSSQQSVNGAVKSICDIMRRSNCKGATKYVPELTWILFLRILDDLEQREAEESAAVGRPFTPALAAPYRWQDWAAPASPLRDIKKGGTAEKVWDFVHDESTGLLATLRGFADPKKQATQRQRLIAQILSDTPSSRLNSAKDFCDVLDKVDALGGESVDTTHVFPLSQVYEGLLLKMGEKGNDGGQFFTPREIIRLMVSVINPKVGETVYDPGCGTGGFLAEAYAWMKTQVKKPQDLETLKHRTFYGRETDDMTYPIALANLLLHEIDEPHIWHGNTLNGVATYDGLFSNAPQFFDTILMNPPFGGKEGKAAQTHFDFPTSSTQCLFLQHTLKHMKAGSRCGIVLDEGLLFRKNDKAFVKTKQKLLEECDVWCIISLPAGVFLSAGAGVKTDLVFFTKGKPTERIWYFDISDIKVGRKSPLTTKPFDDRKFYDLLKTRGESDWSWNIDFGSRRDTALAAREPLDTEAAELRAKLETKQSDLRQKRKGNASEKALLKLEDEISALDRQVRDLDAKAQDIEWAIYDLKAVNPRAKREEDNRTAADLLASIDLKGKEADAALAELARLLKAT